MQENQFKEFKPENVVFEDISLEREDRLVDQIKYTNDLNQEVRVTDEWHSDGTYLWQWSKLRGLVRMNRNKDFSPIESTMIRNESAIDWNIVSFFVLN